MPIKPSQQKALQAALEKRRGALLAELHGDAARSREEPYAKLTGEVHDLAEQSVADVMMDTGHAELSRDLTELREIEQALKALAEGRYGTCADCGVGIDLARLQAAPQALRCARCQRRQDKTHGAKRATL